MSKDEESGTKRVKPADLDIYFEPKSVIPYSSLEEKPYALQKYVSVVRKKLWTFKDVTLNAYKSAEASVVGAKDGIVDVYESAKSDPLSMVRPGCITAAVIAGAVVQGRGKKPFLRLTSASVAGALVASVAYPDKAFKVAKNVYMVTKDASVSLAEKMRNIADQAKGTKTDELANATMNHERETVDEQSDDGGTGEFPEVATVGHVINADESSVEAERKPSEGDPQIEGIALVQEPSDVVINIIKDDSGEEICLLENSVTKSNADDSKEEGSVAVMPSSDSVESSLSVEEENIETEVTESKSEVLLMDNDEKSQESPSDVSHMQDEEKPVIASETQINPTETYIPNEEVMKSEEVKEERSPSTDNAESFYELNENKGSESQVDYGQSSPEDQDMYSTRT